MIEFWHNPRCSKSRQALALLQECDVEIAIIEYLKHPPSLKRLKQVATLLGLKPVAMMRQGEAVFAELALAGATDEHLFKAMQKHPILIERPIVITGKKAVIGRPPEKVLTL